MTAALVVLSVFAGIALVVGTVALAILVANGKLTFPNTNMRRLQHAKVELQLEEFAYETEKMRTNRDLIIDARVQRALTPPEGDDT